MDLGFSGIWLVGLCAAFFALIGLLAVRAKKHTLEDHLVSRNTAGSFTGAATVAASIIGAWVLFSPAETAMWAGLAGVAGYALGQAAPLFAFAWLGPRMRRLMPRGHSLTEYVRHRFGIPMYLMTLAIMLFYMFVFLAAEMTAIAQAIRLVADVPLVWTALIVAVGTVAYTSYGGLRASIFTDRIQFILIVPLLLFMLIGTLILVGGTGPAFDTAYREAPHLFSITHTAGIEFGFTLIIAVLAANMFHQGFWQRVYACRDERTLRRAYLVAGVLVIPMVFMAGLFGLIALSAGVPAESASVALFAVITETFPPWMTLVVLVLAIALVMSSMDTLLNGIASAVTSDLAQVRPNWTGLRLLRSTRWITALVAIPAVWIASRGYSVLYLFLVADLVCAGALFPVFYGLFARRFTGTAAVTATVIGIGVGVLYFPAPDFTPLFDIPYGGRFLISFASAIVASTVVAVAWHRIAIALKKTPHFDFSLLAQHIKLIGDS